MTLAFTGNTGSGKTFGVVKHVICPCLALGRTVITNVKLKLDALGADFSAGQVVLFSEDMLNQDDIHAKYPGAVWVLDECWRFFNYATAAQMPRNVGEWFRMQRHSVGADGRSSEIVLISQDISDIPKCIRILVHENYHAVKLSAVGAPDRFTCEVYRMDQGERKDHVRSIFDKYSAPWWDYYQSQTMVVAESGITHGEENSNGSRAVVWKRPIFLVTGVFLLALPFLVWASIHNFKSAMGMNDDEPRTVKEAPLAAPEEPSALPPKATAPARPEAAPVAVPEPVVPTRVEQLAADPEESSYWRLSGWLDYPERDARVWLVSGNDGRLRQLPWDQCGPIIGTSQHRCEMDDGTVITAWTGQRSNMSAAVMGNNAR